MTAAATVALICAPVATPIGGPTGGSAAAAGPLDGTYHGTTQLEGAGNSLCAKDGTPIRLTVADNQVTFNFYGTILTGTAAADGAFTASGMNVRYHPPQQQTITGTISGGGIDAQMGSAGCKYHLVFKKG